MIRVCFKQIAKHYSNHWILCTQIYKHIPLPSPLSLSFSVFLFLSLSLSLSTLFLPYTHCVWVFYLCVYVRKVVMMMLMGTTWKEWIMIVLKVTSVPRLNGRGEEKSKFLIKYAYWLLYVLFAIHCAFKICRLLLLVTLFKV